ncbi:hypothetical protein SDC9_209089 [bioreactor metagenome]|uniref:Uncharacterized protein n=1 Tax=bioreactor metagenome TaxID=1076179 RepID=A0A645JP38_9ZZZZ
MGVDDARVYNDGHSLDIANLLDEGFQQWILHFSGDEGVAQQTPVDRQHGVQRIEAGADLHLLDFVDGLFVGEQYPDLLQWRTTVGEDMLDR